MTRRQGQRITGLAHGGQDAENKRAFVSGIVADNQANIPWNCNCTWVVRGNVPNTHWALKYTSYSCPVQDHRLAHQKWS